MAVTVLRPQAMDSITRLVSKVIAISRDLTAATADVSYTGIGFVPTSMQVVYSVDGTVLMGSGFSDSNKDAYSVEQYYGGLAYVNPFFITADPSAGNLHKAVVKSYDADGFTLTWTKVNSPTGTLLARIICYR